MATQLKRRSYFSYLAWWRTESAEIDRQVAEYHSLRLWQSARGMSLLCCAYSCAVTILVGARLLRLSPLSILIEVATWGALGAKMYQGKKWAFVAAMILWTFEKGYSQYHGFSSGTPSVSPFFWWASYMSVFMLGYRTESARNTRAPVLPVARVVSVAPVTREWVPNPEA